MSGTDSGNDPRPPTRDSDDLAKLLEMVREVARREAVRTRIAEYQEDLAQAVMLEFCNRGRPCGDSTSREEVEREVKSLAAREVRRRKAEHTWQGRQAEVQRGRAARNPRDIHKAPINLLSAQPRKRKGIPTLCLQFVRLANGTGHEADMAWQVLAAAAVVARRPRMLTPRQFTAFTLAYVHEMSVCEIATSLGTTHRGVIRTLERIVERLEDSVIAEVFSPAEASAFGLRASAQPGVRIKKENISLSGWRVDTCVRVIRALGQFSLTTRGN